MPKTFRVLFLPIFCIDTAFPVLTKAYSNTMYFYPFPVLTLCYLHYQLTYITSITYITSDTRITSITSVTYITSITYNTYITSITYITCITSNTNVS